MDRLKMLDEIAEIGQRLAKLRETHREVMNRRDQDLINLVQAETRRLMEMKTRLMVSAVSKTPDKAEHPPARVSHATGWEHMRR
jgi:hypothetical protein